MRALLYFQGRNYPCVLIDGIFLFYPGSKYCCPVLLYLTQDVLRQIILSIETQSCFLPQNTNLLSALHTMLACLRPNFNNVLERCGFRQNLSQPSRIVKTLFSSKSQLVTLTLTFPIFIFISSTYFMFQMHCISFDLQN